MMQPLSGSQDGSGCLQADGARLLMLRSMAWGSPAKLDYVLFRIQFIREAINPLTLFEAHPENVSHDSSRPLGTVENYPKGEMRSSRGP